MISIIGATHPGQREHNEDCFVADAEQGLGLVADGMGGYACGEVASDLVRQTVVAAVADKEGLKEAIARAHAVIREQAEQDSDKQGMGSTAIAVKWWDRDYEIAWVGDSRAYLWSPQLRELKQITRDHSYVESLLRTGSISQEEAINHPNRNLITQAVGVAGDDGLEIEVVCGRLMDGQQLMLCSDGLVDEVLDEDIARIMLASPTPKIALKNLVNAAVDAGGHDNISIVIAWDQGKSSALPGQEPNSVRLTRLPEDADDSQPGNSSSAIVNQTAPEPLDVVSFLSSHKAALILGLASVLVLGVVLLTLS